jgi:CBS domain-containing protein
MTTARTILQEKGSDVWSVTPDTLVFEALRIMAEKNVGALIVLHDEKVAGIFSERDYARKVILKGKSSNQTAVKEIMTPDVITVGPDQWIEECMSLMSSKHIRHLPVLENNKVIGMISIGDVVKAIIHEKERTIKHLENYITGSQ